MDPPAVDERVSIAQQISSWAGRDGERIAVRLDDEALTYADLVGRATSLASRLVAGEDTAPVIVACARRPESLAALVGVFLAGRVCVPIDQSDPDMRMAEVATRVGASRIVWASNATTRPRPNISGVELLDMPTESRRNLAPVAVPDATDLAAVIFTSGSTGRPKGVVYDHALMETLAKSEQTEEERTTDANLLSANLAPFNYLGGFWCLFDLCHGRTITMFDASTRGPAALADWIDRERLTHVDLVASLARAVVATMPKGRRFETVRSFGCYGEVLAWRDVALLREHLQPGARITNGLGTTEAPAVTNYVIEWDDPLGSGAAPIGRPYDSVEVRLDPETGEIVVHSTAGLARGYWDDPELDAARFGRDGDGTRTYRTGDIATHRDDGAYVHRGRLDDAVKVSGFLVEPIEAQLALLAIDGVADAAVLGENFGDGRNRLVAHVALEPDSPHDVVSLRAELRRQLASHLVPARIVLHDELPHTPRGKVDRERLRRSAPGAREGPAGGPNELQRAVTEAFRVVLDRDVDVDSDFWELGGDSLGAQEVVTALADTTGIELPLAGLLEDATVAGVAARLGQLHPKTLGVCVPLHRDGNAAPMWCVAGGGGTALAFRALAIALGPDQPIMVLEANGLQHRGRPDWTVESAARRFVRAIRVEQPIGPYRIAGFSYGGLVAYEIGRRLRAAGEQVEFVALLDAPTPGVSSRTLAEAIGGDRDGRHSPGRTRRVRRAMQVATAGIRPRMSTEYFGRFLLIAERAARHYRPPSTTLPLVVVEAVFTDAGYWRSLADDVDVTQVPTTHLTLLQPPHVEDVAAVLKRRLVQY